MISDDRLERFRMLSIERIDRVEASWNRIIIDHDRGTGILDEMLREVHTLRGDASIVGSTSIHRLSQKLEDLIEMAGEPRFEISDDFELVVTMAIQFLGMLLRSKQPAMAGLDLEGFIRQVDDVLRESRAVGAPRPRRITPRTRSASDPPPLDRIADDTRQRLAGVAARIYLEHVAAGDETSRARLLNAWATLRDELGRLESTELSPLLQRHAASARELSHRVGKPIEIESELADVRVDPRAAQAVDVAVLHLVRNAIDHGIEPADERAQKHKPVVGRLRLSTAADDAGIEVVVADDGCGIDPDAVRAAAVARGLIEPDRVVDDAAAIELVFAPGLSTRPTVGELSGRGVGLDAVRSAVSRVGGRTRIASSPAGTAITIAIPVATRSLPVYRFLAPGNRLPLAISARWTPTVEPAHDDAIDPMRALGYNGVATIPAMSVRLRWGFLDLAVRAASPPILVTADRICPTSDEQPMEVVAVEGQETLLLRPELLVDRRPRDRLLARRT
jgi:chemotaxis protein histidine kinase CheA